MFRHSAPMPQSVPPALDLFPSLSGGIRTGDGQNGRRSVNFSAYWKPSLLLLAFAATGTASSTATV